jgi:hypothetical protein
MNFAPAPLQYVRDVWQGILNEIRRVDTVENAKRDRANTFRGSQTLAGLLDAQQDFRLSGDIAPAQITGNQDNFNPAGLSTASVLRLSTDASRNITGIQGGADGRVLILYNVGSFPIVLKNDVTSTAANRFLFGADLTLQAGTGIALQYDGTSSRWRGINTRDTPGFNIGQVSGRYYFGVAPTSLTPAAVVANVEYFMPFWVPIQRTYTEIGFRVTTLAAGSNAQAAMYNAANGVPATKILSTSNISVGTTGAKTAVISQQLNPGMYFLGFCSNGAPSVEFYTEGLAGIMGSATDNGMETQAFSVEALGTWSNNPAISYSATSNTFPKVWLRF